MRAFITWVMSFFAPVEDDYGARLVAHYGFDG
jgi:hypothetical protein